LCVEVNWIPLTCQIDVNLIHVKICSILLTYVILVILWHVKLCKKKLCVYTLIWYGVAASQIY
jgi:hypothetical protein